MGRHFCYSSTSLDDWAIRCNHSIAKSFQTERFAPWRFAMFYIFAGASASNSKPNEANHIYLRCAVNQYILVSPITSCQDFSLAMVEGRILDEITCCLLPMWIISDQKLDLQSHFPKEFE